MTDRLYLVNPGWTDEHGGPWYCPAGAVIEGVLAFHPELRDRLDIAHVDFPRPRPMVVRELGDELQSCPVLVLDGEFDWPEAGVSPETGARYLQDEAIVPYLAARYGIARPHP